METKKINLKAFINAYLPQPVEELRVFEDYFKNISSDHAQHCRDAAAALICGMDALASRYLAAPADIKAKALNILAAGIYIKRIDPRELF